MDICGIHYCYKLTIDWLIYSVKKDTPVRITTATAIRHRRGVPSLVEHCQKAVGKWLGQHYGNNPAAMRNYLHDAGVPEHLQQPIIKFGMSAALQHQQEILAQDPKRHACRIM